MSAVLRAAMGEALVCAGKKSSDTFLQLFKAKFLLPTEWQRLKVEGSIEDVKTKC